MAYKRTIAVLTILLVFSFGLNVILAIGLFSKVQDMPTVAEPSPTPVQYSDVEPTITKKPQSGTTLTPTANPVAEGLQTPQSEPTPTPTPVPTPTVKPTKKPQRKPTPTPVQTPESSGGVFGNGASSVPPQQSGENGNGENTNGNGGNMFGN